MAEWFFLSFQSLIVEWGAGQHNRNLGKMTYNELIDVCIVMFVMPLSVVRSTGNFRFSLKADLS